MTWTAFCITKTVISPSKTKVHLFVTMYTCIRTTTAFCTIHKNEHQGLACPQMQSIPMYSNCDSWRLMQLVCLSWCVATQQQKQL
jgi:hypothetical protein